MWNLKKKNGTDNLIYRPEIETETQNKHKDTKWERRGWDELGD